MEFFFFLKLQKHIFSSEEKRLLLFSLMDLENSLGIKKKNKMALKDKAVITVHWSWRMHNVQTVTAASDSIYGCLCLFIFPASSLES